MADLRKLRAVVVCGNGVKLFGRTAAPDPQVIFGLIAATYSSKLEQWAFEYEGITHVSYGQVLHLFNNSCLEMIQADISVLMPEMKERLKFGWKDWENVKIADGEKYFINVTEFQETGKYGICWTGGKSWGDMEIEFTIKDHQVIDEWWSD